MELPLDIVETTRNIEAAATPTVAEEEEEKKKDRPKLPWEAMRNVERLDAEEALHDADVIRKTIEKLGLASPDVDEEAATIDVFSDIEACYNGEACEHPLKVFSRNPGVPCTWQVRDNLTVDEDDVVTLGVAGEPVDTEGLVTALVAEARGLRAVHMRNEQNGEEAFLGSSGFWFGKQVKKLLSPRRPNFPEYHPLTGEDCVLGIVMADHLLTRLKPLVGPGKEPERRYMWHASVKLQRWYAAIKAHSRVLMRISQTCAFYFGEVVPYETGCMHSTMPDAFIDFYSH